MGQMKVVLNAAKDSGGGAMAEDGPLAKAIKTLTEKMGAQSDSIARINTSVTSQMSVMQSLHDSGHASSLEGGRRGGLLVNDEQLQQLQAFEQKGAAAGAPSITTGGGDGRSRDMSRDRRGPRGNPSPPPRAVQKPDR